MSGERGGSSDSEGYLLFRGTRVIVKSTNRGKKKNPNCTGGRKAKEPRKGKDHKRVEKWQRKPGGPQAKENRDDGRDFSSGS